MIKEFWTLYLIGSTPKAYLFSTNQKGEKGKNVWIPKSACEIVTHNAPKANEWKQVNVYIDDWAAKKFPADIRANRSTDYDIIQIGPPPKPL